MNTDKSIQQQDKHDGDFSSLRYYPDGYHKWCQFSKTKEGDEKTLSFKDDAALIAAYPELEGRLDEYKRNRRVGTNGGAGPKHTPEEVAAEYEVLRRNLDQVRRISPKALKDRLYELLPESYWHQCFESGEFPKCLGFHYHNVKAPHIPDTLTVSVFYEDEVKANTFRRATVRGEEIKWLTHGAKTVPAIKLTGKDEVWFASGMGEVLLFELLGVDYIVIQSDSMTGHIAKHLPQDYMIKELVILHDGDQSFEKIIDPVLSAIQPTRAFVFKREGKDPRDIAEELIHPAAFIEAVESEKIEIEVPEPIASGPTGEQETMNEKDLTEDNYCFARLFAKVSKNLFGWSPNRDLFTNWAILHRVFKDAEQGIGKTQAVTMGAGEGKSKGTALYVATEIVRQNKTALIVVNLLVNGYEMAEDINRWSGTSAARVFHTKDNKFDPKKQQVLIITHAMLQTTLHGRGRKGIDDFMIDDGGGLRNLTVIDEAIDLKKSHTITVSAFTYLIGVLETLPKHERFRDEIETILWFSFLIQKSIGGKPKLYETPQLPEGLPTTFPRIRAYLNEKTGGKQDPFLGRDWDSFFDDIETLLVSRHYHVTTKTQTYISTAEDYFPRNASPVILDASADIDYVYRAYEEQGLLKVIRTKPVRTFEGSTIYFIESETSKAAMKEDPAVIAGIEREVSAKTGPNDKALIITHKIVKDELESTVWSQESGNRPKIMNWGDITGRNDARECNVVFVFGLYYKARPAYIDNMLVQYGKVADGPLESRYRNGDITAQLYQAIMRSALRIPQPDGGCIPTKVYVTLPHEKHGQNAQLRNYIKEVLPTKFPGIEIAQWEPETTKFEKALDLEEGYLFHIPDKRRKLTPTQRKLIDLLSEPHTMSRLQAKSKHPFIVDRKQIEQKLKISRNTFRNTITEDLIKEARLLGWYFGYWIVPNPKRPSRVKTVQGFVNALNIEEVLSEEDYRRMEDKNQG